ncbi:hypothetical protein C8R42DRAFT_640016 [Lentinula raphanica]|nr:hypothetical protein C8R42DRAFT_640016 [Lentinula raphanica]
MDGNNSLKRLYQKDTRDEEGVAEQSKEWTDTHGEEWRASKGTTLDAGSKPPSRRLLSNQKLKGLATHPWLGHFMDMHIPDSVKPHTSRCTFLGLDLSTSNSASPSFLNRLSLRPPLATCLLSIARFSYHHDNFKTYARLSKFLVDKYKQAIEIQQSAPALACTMNDLGITSTSIFVKWLKQKKQYLQNLKKEPPEETLQMEYFRKLKKYTAAQNKLNEAH